MDLINFVNAEIPTILRNKIGNNRSISDIKKDNASAIFLGR